MSWICADLSKKGAGRILIRLTVVYLGALELRGAIKHHSIL